MKVIGIIQARMGSSRFPGKSLADLFDNKVLGILCNRLSLSQLDQIIVATSEDSKDKEIREYCKENSIKCFAGNEKDVFLRIKDCVTKNKCDYFLRITADDVFIDNEVVDQFINLIHTKHPKYLTSFTSKSFANGLVISAFNSSYFLNSYKPSLSDFYKEHVIPYFIEMDPLNCIKVYAPKEFQSYGMNLAIDKKSDLERLQKFLPKHAPFMRTSDIISFIKSNQKILTNFREGHEY